MPNRPDPQAISAIVRRLETKDLRPWGEAPEPEPGEPHDDESNHNGELAAHPTSEPPGGIARRHH